MKKLKVEKSLFPEDEKTHIVVMKSNSKNGIGYRRLFKGTFRECEKYKKDLESRKINEKMY